MRHCRRDAERVATNPCLVRFPLKRYPQAGSAKNQTDSTVGKGYCISAGRERSLHNTFSTRCFIAGESMTVEAGRCDFQRG